MKSNEKKRKRSLSDMAMMLHWHPEFSFWDRRHRQPSILSCRIHRSAVTTTNGNRFVGRLVGLQDAHELLCHHLYPASTFCQASFTNFTVPRHRPKGPKQYVLVEYVGTKLNPSFTNQIRKFDRFSSANIHNTLPETKVLAI